MTTISQMRKIDGLASRRYPLRALVLAFLFAAFGATSTAQTPSPGPPESLSAAEFSRLINEFSEDGGYFLSDNFTSNETSYLHIVDKLRELGATGGAYLGVGPEQNFTYIAKIRPRIAFIIDIRRQAIIQHLMFKAVFHLSPDRTQFLARLLSRPAPPANSPGELNQVLAYFIKTPASEQLYAANLAAIKKAIQEDIQFPLSEADQKSLEYVYKNFRTDGLDIAFRMDGSWGGNFPTLKELIVETDLHHKLGHFLASKEDYDFVRDLQRRNLIIPVVGDFAGRKALAAIGGYLKKQGLTVTAFYTSNVEQYLFEGGSDTGFVNNVRKLPINDHSFFIRAIINMRYQHPEQLSGHFSTTLLQRMDVFVQDFDAGRYRSYTEMITTHYIAADRPGVKK